LKPSTTGRTPFDWCNAPPFSRRQRVRSGPKSTFDRNRPGGESDLFNWG
jgi:hypothetical protein